MMDGDQLEIDEKTGELLHTLSLRTGKTETQVFKASLHFLKELLDLRDAETEIFLKDKEENLSRLEVIL